MSSAERSQEKIAIACIIELVGIVLVSFAVAYEIACQADVGYVVISIGSMLIAAGGMIFSKLIPRRDFHRNT